MSGQLPRRGYFSAADRAPIDGGQATQAQKADQARTAGSRQQLALALTTAAEAVGHGVKALRTFDATGHLPAALPNLETAVKDLLAAHVALVESVTRYGDRVERRGRMVNGLELAVAVEQGTPAGTGPAFPLDQRIGLGRANGAEIAGSEHAAALQRSFERHPAGSALAAVDAAEAAAAGEPPLPAPLAEPYTHPSMPGPYPKPGPDAFRVHRNYPG